MDAKYISTAQAAVMLGIHKNTAYKAVEEGRLPSVRFGKRILIPLAKLEELLDCKEKV